MYTYQVLAIEEILADSLTRPMVVVELLVVDVHSVVDSAVIETVVVSVADLAPVACAMLSNVESVIVEVHVVLAMVVSVEIVYNI